MKLTNLIRAMAQHRAEKRLIKIYGYQLACRLFSKTDKRG